MRSKLPVAALVALAVGSAGACGAPRDPDLERRVLEARAAADKAAREAKATPTPAPPPPSTTPNEAAATAPTPATTPPPPARSVEIRTYSSAEVATIIGSLSGSGPAVIAELTTDVGPITCRLDVDRTPQTVANFVALAVGSVPWRGAPKGEPVAAPFYDGLPFYRIVPNFLVESGDPLHDQVHGPGWRIPREDGGGTFFDAPGAIAMLSDAGAIHGSRFFIVVRADKSLADRYAAFGACAEVDLVKRIAEGEQVSKDTPKAPIKIQKVRVYRGE